MEEELSMASNLETTLSCESTLDSNVNNHQNKRLRHSNSISPSRLKGVVAQVNGNWGAQIYTNHQRVWLGTFRSEREAAMAYDSAAIRLRSGDIHRNFAWTSITIQEPNFQKNMSTETVLNMIKDGSYLLKFADFLKMENSLNLNLASKHGKGNFLCTLLFQKELTPSDVGKLNRLVIPKKYALRYFPCISEDGRDDSKNGVVEDVQLFFFDRLLRSWKFRYCYWKSSQSFVFTRGWNRFVKEKELKEKDTVIFSMCECLEGGDHIKTFCMIDIVYKDRLDGNGKTGKRFQIGVAQDDVDGENEMDFEEEENAVHSGESEEEEATEVGSNEVEKKGIRIFGVQMF